MPPRVRATDDVEVTRHLPHQATSAGLARDDLRASLVGQDVDEHTVDEAVQVLSEIVANAVRHADPLPDGTLKVHWTLRRRIIEVDVTDGRSDEQSPHTVRPHPWQTRGRGLRIVRAYAHEWGVLDQPTTRTVWAALGGPSRRRTR